MGTLLYHNQAYIVWDSMLTDLTFASAFLHVESFGHQDNVLGDLTKRSLSPYVLKACAGCACIKACMFF